MRIITYHLLGTNAGEHTRSLLLARTVLVVAHDGVGKMVVVQHGH